MMQDTSTSRGGAGRAQAHFSSAARAAALLLRRCQLGPNPLSDADSLEFRQSGEHEDMYPSELDLPCYGPSTGRHTYK